jgi:hypothetical protein
MVSSIQECVIFVISAVPSVLREDISIVVQQVVLQIYTTCLTLQNVKSVKSLCQDAKIVLVKLFVLNAKAITI